jgi:DNA-binding MarR family transcriptional regulator
MTEASVRAPTIEEIATHLEQVIQLDPAPSPPDWVTANLTFGQLRVLFLLRDVEPVSIGTLADRLGVSLASASEAIDRIERRQLVVRHHGQDDRRVVECRLSERGEQLVEEIAGIRLEGMRRLLGVLTPEELTEFDRLIRLIGARLEAARAFTPSSPTPRGGGGCA